MPLLLTYERELPMSLEKLFSCWNDRALLYLKLLSDPGDCLGQSNGVMSHPIPCSNNSTVKSGLSPEPLFIEWL